MVSRHPEERASVQRLTPEPLTEHVFERHRMVVWSVNAVDGVLADGTTP